MVDVAFDTLFGILAEQVTGPFSVEVLHVTAGEIVDAALGVTKV